MKILVFTKYNAKGPSSYYRVYQFLPNRTTGIDTHVSYFWGEYYFKNILSEKNKKMKIYKMIPGLIMGAIKRIFVTLILSYKYDIIHIEKDFIPGFPVFFEYFFKYILRKKVIFEFDDAVFLSNYPKTKTRSLINLADQVITGNNLLSEYALKTNTNVNIIPTGVDFEYYSNIKKNKRINNTSNTKDTIVVGWIGTSSGLNLVKNLENVFIELNNKGYNYVLKIICDRDIELNINNKEFVKWKRETAIEEMAKFDIGIMPIDQDEFNKYKCGFKLIQYLACNIPVVASPVGVNNSIVQNGINGFLAGNDSEWIESLELLIEDSNLRVNLSTSGYEITKSNFDINKLNDKIEKIYRNLT
jgi:glycosyltransferase involved in cell wall biosynthesis